MSRTMEYIPSQLNLFLNLNLIKIPINITLEITPRPGKWSLAFRFPDLGLFLYAFLITPSFL